MTSSEQYIITDIPTLEQLKSIDEIADLGDKVKALTKLASDLPPSQSEVFQQALAALIQIQDKTSVVRFQFLALLPQVSDADRPEFLELVIAVGDRKPPNIKIITTIVSQIPDEQRPDFMRRTLEAIKFLRAEIRFQFLAPFIPYMSETERSQVFQAALDIKPLGFGEGVSVYGEEYESFEGSGWSYVVDNLITLVPQIFRYQPDLLEQALEVKQFPIPNKEFCCQKILMSLVLHLSRSESSEFVKRALEGARNLSGITKIEAIAALIPYLADSQLVEEVTQEALTAAYEEDRHRSKCLAVLLPQLGLEVVQEALEATLFPLGKDDQALAFIELVPHISVLCSSHPELLQKALDVARRIGQKDNRGYGLQALAALVPLITLDSQRFEILQEILESTRQNQDAERRAKILTSIVSFLPSYQQLEVLQETLEAISISKLDNQAEALATLTSQISNLPAELLLQALEVAQDIKGIRYRAEALISLIPLFSISPRSVVLQQAFNVAEQLLQQKPVYWQENLPLIFLQLSPFQPELLQKALEIIDIESNSVHFELLAILASRLPPSHPELLERALDIANKSSNIKALSILASRLSSSNPKLLKKALDISHNLIRPQDQAKTLAALSPHLTEIEGFSNLKRALDLIRNRQPVQISPEEYSNYRQEYYRYNLEYVGEPLSLEELQKDRENGERYLDLDALAALVPHLDEPQRSEALQQILVLGQDAPSYGLDVFAELAVQLSEVDYSRLSQILELIKDEKIFADTVLTLAPKLMEPQRSALFRQAYKNLIASEYKSEVVERLAALILLFPISEQPEILQECLDKMCSINARNFTPLALQFPDAVLPRLLELLLPLNEEDLIKTLKPLAITCPEELVLNLPNYKFPVALEMIVILEEDTDKVRFLSTLAPRLSTGIFSRAVRLIESEIKDDIFCSEALSNLASYLPEDQFLEVLNLIKRRIKDEFSQAEALSNLVPYLKLFYLPKALHIAQDLKAQIARFKALLAISEQLHSLLNNVSSDSQEVVALSGASVSEEVLQIELSKVEQIEHIDTKVKALIALANHLTGSQKTKILSSTLETVPGIQYEAYRAEALNAIITQLSCNESNLLLQALNFTQQIQDKYYYAVTLANLAPKLPEPQRAELLRFCLDAAQQIQTPYAQATVLAEVAPYLSDHLCVEQFQQAINIAEQIEYEAERVEAFTVIASRLSSAHPNLLQQVLEITQKFEAREYRDRITQVLGDNLSIALIQQILETLQSNTEEKCEKYSSDILCALSPHFLEIQLPDVFKTIEIFQDEGYKAQALQALAFQLSNNLGKLLITDQKQLDEIWEIVRNFQEEYFKVKVYSVSSTTIRQAEFIANNIYKKFKFLGTEAFLEIAINSTSVPALTKALEAIRDELLNNHACLRANYLNRLAPYLRSSRQCLEAQLIARNIEEDYYCVQSLSVLANYFPELRQQAEEAAKQVSDLVHRIELLSALANETPTILPDLIKLLRKESENNEITNSINRKRILVALQPHLPARIVREIDLERKAGRRLSDELWNRALKQLARSYREALKSGGLRNDEALDQDLLNLRDEINSLANLLLLRDLEPPMVVGILGNWGGGKSYIMHLMQAHMIAIRSQALEQQEAWSDNPFSERLSPYVGHIYQIKFDAWSFAKSDLWASLMQTIFFELNRQISLELSLQDIGIAPLDDYGNEIWKVLYKTNENDRQYFLEQILGKDKLEELKTKVQSRGESWTDLLWEQYGVTETIASTYRLQKEKELNDVQEQLKRAKEKKETILSDITDKDKQENWVSALLKETTELSGFIIRKYFGRNVAEALQKEVEQKLKEEDIDVFDLNKMVMAINRTVTDILEEDTICIGGDKKKYSLSWLALKKWLKKNQKLIIAFVLSIACSIILPTLVAQVKSLNIVSQLAALITSLIPAIGFAQALFKSNQKWFTQARQSIQDYENTLKQLSQDKYHNLIDERVIVNLRQLDAEVQNLTVQEQTLQQEVKQAEAALPKDSFTSLANFVKARVEEATYDKHLGIMQQVRQDLIKLSQALLPPPASSTEYKIKLEKLKKFFPRGPARVVVYIDDLDRCPPDRVVEVLEAIQLLVKTPLFIAVLAIDERYIIRALEKHYAGILSRRGRPSGEDYLEKIIQIPYRVRPISASALENYLRSQVVIQDTATGGTKFSEVSRDEFNLLLDCCRYVDLSPRTIKRLTNVYKVFKVVCRTRGTKPSRKVQQAIIALLVLSGRHTHLMREVFSDMEAHYEGKGSGEQETIWKLINNFYESNCSLIGDSYSQREFDRFKQDALTTQLIPRDLTLALLTYDLFNLVRSFSFVGDVGYAAEDFRSVARAESVDQ